MIISCGHLGSQLGKNVIDFHVENTMRRQCVYVPQQQCHTKIKQAIKQLCKRDEHEHDFRNTGFDNISSRRGLKHSDACIKNTTGGSSLDVKTIHSK